MAQSIQQSTTHVNALISLSHFDVSTLDNQLPTQASAKNKHAIINNVIHGKGYSNNIESTLRALVNCSSDNGICDASQITLSRKANISRRTLKRCLAILTLDGLLKIKKKGWRKTNAVTIVPLNTKLRHKEANLAYDLNLNINLLDNINNITYSEYESAFPNSLKEKNPGLNTPIQPQLDPVRHQLDPKPKESILKSERDVSREALEEPLQELVNEEIELNQQIAVTNTLKRLKAPLNAKIELTKKIAQVSKQTTIRNIGGMIVYLFKNMMESKPTDGGGIQMKNHMDVFKLNQDAETLALGRLKANGIYDPRKDCSQDYEAIRAYDSQLATMLTLCLRELTTKPTTEDKELTPRKTWAERAYS